MSATYNWCQDKTRLAIYDKQVFFDTRLGDKYWFLNGKRHRVNGPAIEYANGSKYWWLNGVCFTKSDYWHVMKETNE